MGRRSSVIGSRSAYVEEPMVPSRPVNGPSHEVEEGEPVPAEGRHETIDPLLGFPPRVEMCENAQDLDPDLLIAPLERAEEESLDVGELPLDYSLGPPHAGRQRGVQGCDERLECSEALEDRLQHPLLPGHEGLRSTQ